MTKSWSYKVSVQPYNMIYITRYESKSILGESEICLNQLSKYRQICDSFAFGTISKPEFIQT